MIPRRNALFTAEPTIAMMVLAVCMTALASPSWAQVGGGGQPGQGNNVFGIRVDADGVVRPVFGNDKTGRLDRKRRAELADKSLPADVNSSSTLRKVSLVRLEAACEVFAEKKESVSTELQYLAGLQRIDYVFVDPDEQDIVIAGPAEGFAVDDFGRAIGVGTGRPPLRLDDLVVALRALERGSVVGCSIDPAEANLARLKAYVAQNSGAVTAAGAKARYEEFQRILGMHNVRVFGVPADSHFAEVLVEADYRMKRLSMGLDSAGVRGFKSHLAMLGPGANMMQRWWFAPLFEPFTRSADGLAFQIAGQRLQLMAQDEIVSDSGKVTDAPFTRASEQKFAKHFTDKFPELADANPVFAELQNIVDLAIVAALLKKERLPEKVGWLKSLLLDAERFPTVKGNIPRSVAATMNYKSGGSRFIGLIGGGITVDARRTVMQHEWRTETDGKLHSTRQASTPRGRPEAHPWWWD
jgi:hypothetical protein